MNHLNTSRSQGLCHDGSSLVQEASDDIDERPKETVQTGTNLFSLSTFILSGF